MKKILILLAALLCGTSLRAIDYSSLPRQIASGPGGRIHVQGIAVDTENQFVYMSFTTHLIKYDFAGNVVGSVIDLAGHLGGMALNPDDGRLYASLEYKHDVIGKGIGTAGNDDATGFYIAIFDVDRINRKDMNPNEVMTTVYIREAVEDHMAKTVNQGREVDYRHGCSGIDGVAIAPAAGKKDGRMMLYTAYGVYGDLKRTDNDYQVILCYDISKWKKFEQPLTRSKLHQSGPKKPAAKYFVYTGNTEYGIQNLAYDKDSHQLVAAVYKGKKPNWPNYNMFVIDRNAKPKKELLKGFDQPTKGLTLPLAKQGEHDAATNTWGIRFPWGSTGLCSLGNGYYYVSHNKRENNVESTVLHLYNWDGATWTMVK